MIGDCTEMLSSLDNFIQITILFPIKIRSPYPNEPFRMGYKKLYTEVRNIRSVEAANYDCITSDEITIFQNQFGIKYQAAQTPICQ